MSLDVVATLTGKPRGEGIRGIKFLTTAAGLRAVARKKGRPRRPRGAAHVNNGGRVAELLPRRVCIHVGVAGRVGSLRRGAHVGRVAPPGFVPAVFCAPELAVGPSPHALLRVAPGEGGGGGGIKIGRA